jgi:hypothetical protein
MPSTSQSALPVLPVGLLRAKHLAKWLDTVWTVPILNKKIGLDPLLSLVPYAGSVVSGGISLYVLWTAVQCKVPPSLLIQMLVNILIDVTAGELPFVGVLLDAMWRSNTRNIQLLEKALARQGVVTLNVDQT